MINVRAYNERDLQQLIEVYQSAFAEPPWNETWTSEQVIEDLELALSQKDPIVLVADENNMLLGMTWRYRLPLDKFPFLEGRVKSNCSYMDEIAVRGNYRKRGIGRMLGNAYLLETKMQRMNEVALRTDERNEASMALFKSIGFGLLGIRDPEYCNRQYLLKRLS
jgi:ribosomal protein S18 acetylase RimI-like enzyme